MSSPNLYWAVPGYAYGRIFASLAKKTSECYTEKNGTESGIMDLNNFRIFHSTLIEHYQFIEAHLEGIYAAVSGKSFADGLREVERDSLGGVVREIKELEREKKILIFTGEEYDRLREIIDRRNYWCHCCYFEMAFDRQTGGPAKVRDVQALFADLKTAEQWREQLFEKKLSLMKPKD